MWWTNLCLVVKNSVKIIIIIVIVFTDLDLDFCCCLFVCCQGNTKKQLSWNWKVLLSWRKKRTYYNLVQTEWQYACYFNFKIISVIWATWELIFQPSAWLPGSWEGTEVKGQSLGVCNNVSVWWNPNELFVDLILATG